jgi:hypothetical protein
MKRWISLALLIFVGTAGWRVGESLSPDALSMAVGVLFGVMAGVPTALLVMAGGRRNAEKAPGRDRHAGSTAINAWNAPYASQPYAQQYSQPYAQHPPIIVVAGPQGFGGAPQSIPADGGWFPQERPARHFTVVGEQEELVEDW